MLAAMTDFLHSQTTLLLSVILHLCSLMAVAMEMGEQLPMLELVCTGAKIIHSELYGTTKNNNNPKVCLV